MPDPPPDLSDLTDDPARRVTSQAKDAVLLAPGSDGGGVLVKRRSPPVVHDIPGEIDESLQDFIDDLLRAKRIEVIIEAYGSDTGRVTQVSFQFRFEETALSIDSAVEKLRRAGVSDDLVKRVRAFLRAQPVYSQADFMERFRRAFGPEVAEAFRLNVASDVTDLLRWRRWTHRDAVRAEGSHYWDRLSYGDHHGATYRGAESSLEAERFKARAGTHLHFFARVMDAVAKKEAAVRPAWERNRELYVLLAAGVAKWKTEPIRVPVFPIAARPGPEGMLFEWVPDPSSVTPDDLNRIAGEFGRLRVPSRRVYFATALPAPRDVDATTPVTDGGILPDPAPFAATIEELVRVVRKARGQLRLEIHGYTDRAGEPAANVELSRRRAQWVRDHVVARLRSDGLEGRFAAIDMVAHGEAGATEPDHNDRERYVELILQAAKSK